MLARGQELAYHISRNKEIKHFPEDEREGLVMYVKALKSKRRPDADVEEGRDWLRKLAQDTKKSLLGQIMNYAETQKYLLTLDSLEPHFDYLSVYSVSWAKANLHHIGGGVSSINHCTLLIFKGYTGNRHHRRISREYLAVASLRHAIFRDGG
jgi:hypothetical protein